VSGDKKNSIQKIYSSRCKIILKLNSNSPPDNGQFNTNVRISHVELYNVGQSMRVGRYPIYFNRAGNLSNSYIKNTTIHQSFSRAIHLLSSNNLTVENNFVFDIMGSAFALQDGSEINNVFRQNLAISVKGTASSLAEDLTPGKFLMFIILKH
jgi:hypothetical protein